MLLAASAEREHFRADAVWSIKVRPIWGAFLVTGIFFNTREFLSGSDKKNKKNKKNKDTKAHTTPVKHSPLS